MSNKLSFSSVNTYDTCSMKYNYHYILKYRPKTTSSALVFGSAFDKAINALFEGKDAEEEFIKEFSSFTLNGVVEDTATSINITFSQKDFDKVLCQGIAEEYEPLLNKKREKIISKDEMARLNFIYFSCMKEKGLMMLTAYKEQILPRIKKPLAYQKEIKIDNDKGDTIIGYVDLVAVWEDGSTVIFDLKTAGEAYPADAVIKSTQLSLYCYALENFYNTRRCGFIVFNKNIKKMKDGKKCKPYIDVQVLIDEMPLSKEEETVMKFELTNVNIKNKVFDKNPDSCYNFGRCQFYNLCHKDDDSDVIKMVK